MSADKQIEEGLTFTPKFDTNGLIPAIAQDHATGEILMLAYMNAQSLALTLETGEATYWSRSRQTLWKKGETSGHIQKVVGILTDCDQDAIILKIIQVGGEACHTGRRSCFYRAVTKTGGNAALQHLKYE